MSQWFDLKFSSGTSDVATFWTTFHLKYIWEKMRKFLKYVRVGWSKSSETTLVSKENASTKMIYAYIILIGSFSFLYIILVGAFSFLYIILVRAFSFLTQSRIFLISPRNFSYQFSTSNLSCRVISLQLPSSHILIRRKVVIAYSVARHRPLSSDGRLTTRCRYSFAPSATL